MWREKGITISEGSRTLTDFFKGIAIILVFLVHAQQSFNLPKILSLPQRFGQMGCQIFFVLSAFGLCYSFSGNRLPFVPYMKKRLGKLLVGYYGAIVLHTMYRVLLAVVQGQDVVSALNIPGIVVNLLFLNGFVPNAEINNAVVRGGGYVGTTVILYALFPLLYAIYFAERNEFWKKFRIVVFPLSIFCATSLVIIAAGFIHPAFACENNSFAYFSFVNQLTPFALGLVLFDMKDRNFAAKKALLFSLVSLLVSIILFFGDFKYSFVFCPTFAAASFLWMYMWISSNRNICNKIENGSNCVIRAILKFGKNSFAIYLTHSFIVYGFCAVALKLLHLINDNNLLWYVVLLPIEFCLVYFVGAVYHKCIAQIKK